MNQPEQVEAFHAALVAFEIRFERELTASWQDLESKAAAAIMSAPSGSKKRAFLERFFDDAQDQLAGAVHLYFPKLLQVATTGRQRLETQSPLSWTQAQVWTQVCNFLDIDETFDHTSAPREDSRVLHTALRIATNTGWLYDESPAASQLPEWAASRWSMLLAMRRGTDAELSGMDTESLSLAETKEWAKHREFRICRRLEKQIEDEKFDGIIEAGKTGVSVLDSFVVAGVAAGNDIQANSAVNETLPENQFVRESATWAIMFAAEKCRLATMVGLDYIFLLLQHPGRSMSALELQVGVAGLPFASRRTASLALGEISPAMDSGHENDRPSRDEVVDYPARRKAEARLSELEEMITARLTIGDQKGASDFQPEYSRIESYLERSRNVHGRSRAFSDENEKARQSITHALKRAYTKIRAQAPKTADHLESQISSGSEFIFRDYTTPWQVRRNPLPLSRS